MNPTNDSLSYSVALAVMEQLVQSGVRSLVASPGYRNSPLLLAAHHQEGLEVFTAVDERGAAFLALGLSKSGSPAALACTSGTAVANYFPAVMEAFHSHVPLVVLTADRPPELVGTGSNQCTDQTKVFGGHVRFFAEIPCADPSFDGPNHARFAVGKAVALCAEPAPGPVHVNIRFREPFLPDDETVAALHRNRAQPALPWKFLPSSSGPGREQWAAVEALFAAAERPLLLVGAGDFSRETLLSLVELSEKTGYPILAENASGLPLLGSATGFISSRVEETLHEMGAGKIAAPDLVVRFGAPLTGKGLGRLLKVHPVPQLIFDHWGESREPHLHPSILVQGGLSGWLAAILRSGLRSQKTAWRDEILATAAAKEKAIDHLLRASSLTEWLFHRQLAEKMGDGSVIFLGNSMPIRDFNSVFAGSRKAFTVKANRGLSGIDGLIATAAGVALGSKKETHVVLGDLSTLHDVSSLSLLSSLRDRLELTLWVMNNGGGEIFRIVPTARASGKPEWFTTPQAYDLAALAKAFQLPFARLTNRADWESLAPLRGPGVRIVELMADREENLKVRSGLKG